jgi:hypothetical protein
MTGAEALEAHLKAGAFVLGTMRGRWRRVDATFPTVIIEVRARDGRWFALRFDCTGYPTQAPTATLWDLEHQRILLADQWPCGGRVSQVFNPRWVNCEAIYLPCDRRAIQGHHNWFGDYPQLIWRPDVGLFQYVSAVWEVLQSHELQPRAA